MKTTIRNLLTVILLIATLISVASCGGSDVDSNVWKSATYVQNTTFGDGETTVTVDVSVGKKTVTFELRTDMTTLGAALLEHNLIAGKQDVYGIYVTTVNGITVDYDKDKCYWAFYKDGGYLPSGVDSTLISDGDHYEIVYTKD